MVHAYGFANTDDLGAQTEAVCHTVFNRHASYDQVILLGGWHDCRLPARPTSAELMQKWLVMRGVPKEKSITQFSIGGDAAHKIPPRDTIEEADLAGQILRQLYPKDAPRTIPFDVAGMWFHKRRIKMIWKSRKARCEKFLSAASPETKLFAKGMLKRICQEPPGIVITWLDPYGQSDFFKTLHEKRTHLTEPGQVLNRTHPLVWAITYSPTMSNREKGT